MEIGAFTGSLDTISLNNALRYTFFSVGIRELVHHVIDRLGPNENVIDCDWWKNRPRKKDNTTAKRTEKMEYAIRAGLSEGLEIVPILHWRS
ncbi:hypothetical protein [Paenibacillus silvae]|uniref:pPIWI-associating nuclease domain-containing protein n=1 Tax=Paenibacillus silvae TaxID=1325358 RepID=UPI0033902B95